MLDRYILSNDKHKINLVWSPKAACCTAVRTFFDYIVFEYNQEGWVHLERPKFLESEFCNDYNENYTTIQFVRNPYYRALSSYLHCLTHNYCNVKSERKTFYDFLLLLSSQDVDQIDSHVTKQYKIDVDYILKIENIENDLTRLRNETDIDLTLNNYENHSFRKIFNKKNNVLNFVGKTFNDELNALLTRFKIFDETLYKSRSQFDESIELSYNDFYDSDIVKLILTIYQKDFFYFEYNPYE